MMFVQVVLLASMVAVGYGTYGTRPPVHVKGTGIRPPPVHPEVGCVRGHCKKVTPTPRPPIIEFTPKGDDGCFRGHCTKYPTPTPPPPPPPPIHPKGDDSYINYEKRYRRYDDLYRVVECIVNQNGFRGSIRTNDPGVGGLEPYGGGGDGGSSGGSRPSPVEPHSPYSG